jgi:transcription antitermination factor NusG
MQEGLENVMSSASSTVSMLAGNAVGEQAHWYAVRTRPRHEKKVASDLQEKGVTTYLPLLKQVHRWSDRRKVIQVPLFPCYAFVYSIFDLPLRLAIYGASGALGFVGPNNQGVPIPDVQIESIRTLMASDVPLMPFPLLKIGQRVRVRGGALDGVEGILATNGDRRLVVSVEGVHVSFSINLEGYDIEPA